MKDHSLLAPSGLLHTARQRDSLRRKPARTAAAMRLVERQVADEYALAGAGIHNVIGKRSRESRLPAATGAKLPLWIQELRISILVVVKPVRSPRNSLSIATVAPRIVPSGVATRAWIAPKQNTLRVSAPQSLGVLEYIPVMLVFNTFQDSNLGKCAIHLSPSASTRATLMRGTGCHRETRRGQSRGHEIEIAQSA